MLSALVQLSNAIGIALCQSLNMRTWLLVTHDGQAMHDSAISSTTNACKAAHCSNFSGTFAGLTPTFAHIRRQFRSYQDADGTMQCFVWNKDQKAVCHCLAAILNVADDSNKDTSS